MIIRAPFSFEVENEEVVVLVSWQQVVDQSDLNVLDRVCERTVVSIFALLDLVGEEVAEFGFVFVFVIEALDSVMSSPTLFSFGALLSFSEFAQFRRVEVIISSSVLD
jgi:hypothetical protein